MRGYLLAGSVLLLAGCSAATPTTEPVTETPNAVTSANAKACSEFENLTAEIGQQAVDNPDNLTVLSDIPERFDAIALRAEGEVRTRIDGVIDALPDPPHMIVWTDNKKTYNNTLRAVSRACEAEGTTLEVTTFVE